MDIPDWLSCANCHHRCYLEADPEVEICTQLLTEIPVGEDFAPDCQAFAFRVEPAHLHKAQGNLRHRLGKRRRRPEIAIQTRQRNRHRIDSTHRLPHPSVARSSPSPAVKPLVHRPSSS